ncbi:Brain mitochondrial carrier protein 1 [Tupaia chinensis]|uniref:Brain mitochondrial carrier protein 1 n=1 Tax=Tupaia chinensis TaxID=246437 RepID=L8Y637_TUPCH|nr:Brain mitochondrial carrier protein 1 [Tupaia chinensis]
MAAPSFPRRRLGYFRRFQCFRVGVAVAFPTVGSSASQSSDEPEQHQKSATVSHEMSGLNWKPFVYGGLASIVAEFDETLLINMICGVVSGVIASTIANPTDVLKIRMQAQGSLFQGSMIGSFIDIYQQEGTRGLWRGVVPTAQRAAIVVGVELPVYDITKKHLILSGMMGDTILTHFVSSFPCGLAGALASNPVDVVRTRMMNQRAIVGHVDLYKGTLDGILKNLWFSVVIKKCLQVTYEAN